jgi:hypothetical protein
MWGSSSSRSPWNNSSGQLQVLGHLGSAGLGREGDHTGGQVAERDTGLDRDGSRRRSGRARRTTVRPAGLPARRRRGCRGRTGRGRWEPGSSTRMAPMPTAASSVTERVVEPLTGSEEFPPIAPPTISTTCGVVGLPVPQQGEQSLEVYISMWSRCGVTATSGRRAPRVPRAGPGGPLGRNRRPDRASPHHGRSNRSGSVGPGSDVAYTRRSGMCRSCAGARAAQGNGLQSRTVVGSNPTRRSKHERFGPVETRPV